MTTFVIFIPIFAYLLGSIPSAILISKILHLPDPRKYGSKNPGATNTLRISGFKTAISVMFFDILKGIIPVWIGYYLKLPPIHLGITIILVCIGHMYPIFFQFYGGKGVATALGALTIISFNLTIIMISTWLFTVLLFKYSSLGAIVTAITIPYYVWFNHPQYFIPVTIISLLILIRHINNIKRLWNRTEKKLWNHSSINNKT